MSARGRGARSDAADVGRYRERGGERESHTLMWTVGGAVLGAGTGWVVADLPFGGATTNQRVRAAAIVGTMGAGWFGANAYLGHRGVNPLILGAGSALVAAGGIAMSGDLRPSANAHVRWGRAIPVVLGCGVGASGIAYLNRP